MKNKLKISFSNKREVRMGSPYMMADLHLEGLDIEIPNVCWQDKFAISKDKKLVALVSFELSSNEPGFVIYLINTDKKVITKTDRNFGLINEISIDEKKIRINKFLFDKTKSKVGELCLNVDEEYDIK